MSHEDTKNRLLQDNNLNILISEPKLSDMLTVYLNDVEGNSHNRGIHSRTENGDFVSHLLSEKT